MSNGIFTTEQAKVEHQTSPRLARELAKVIPSNRNVIDYGCGKGEYLQHLSTMGFKCFGYEGTDLGDLAVYKKIRKCDLTKAIGERPSGTVICLEVAEHIPPKFEDIFIKNITENCEGRLIVSWAIVGQGGCGHLNEQNAAYVIAKFEALGFELNRTVSEQLRTAAGRDLWWFKNSIYVFDKA